MRPVGFLCTFLHEIQGGKIIRVCGHVKFPVRFYEYDHCCLQNSSCTLNFFVVVLKLRDFLSGFEMAVPPVAKQYAFLARGLELKMGCDGSLQGPCENICGFEKTFRRRICR